MFKKGQVVALKEPFVDEPDYFKIAGIVGEKIIPVGENDPRIFYQVRDIRPLTQEEIEGA